LVPDYNVITSPRCKKVLDVYTIISRQSEAPLQMKRALHIASMDDAYARLVFYVAIGWSSLPFSG
jgi:hypothetical protein